MHLAGDDERDEQRPAVEPAQGSDEPRRSRRASGSRQWRSRPAPIRTVDSDDDGEREEEIRRNRDRRLVEMRELKAAARFAEGRRPAEKPSGKEKERR